MAFSLCDHSLQSKLCCLLSSQKVEKVLSGREKILDWVTGYGGLGSVNLCTTLGGPFKIVKGLVNNQ